MKMCWTFCTVCLILVFSGITAKDPVDFQCVDGSRISLRQVCDGPVDCPDGSDERRSLCKHILCPTRAGFRCRYGACVRRAAVCDGRSDCADSSDEGHCGRDADSCTSTEFRCDSGECIGHRQVCDGHVDCTDSSDEAPDTCSNFPCPVHALRCDSGSCVPLSSLCDGEPQCPDGSDESSRRCPGRRCNYTEDCHRGCREGEFLCESGECIDSQDTCNGKSDCKDSSDETQNLCSEKVCRRGWFQCLYGACVRGNATCDGKPDCADWSDEEGPPCSRRRTAVPGGGCHLPWKPPHTHYVARNCSACRPGTRVPPGQQLDYLCDEGHVLRGGATVVCSNASWVPRLPICSPGSGEATCPPLASARLSASCESPRGRRRGWVSCDAPVPAGTVARYRCRRFYEPDGPAHLGNTRAECLRTGRWSREPLACRPECGRLGSEVTPLVMHGQPAPYGLYPWVAALYSLRDEEWSHWCGATLISEAAVITAGHCVWEAEPESVRIAVGKYYRDYEKKQEQTQFRDVREIVIQPVYTDQQGSYGSDIAVLFLATPVELSAVVRPVCIDWDLRRTDADLAEGNMGVVTGWGLDENDTFTGAMKVARLPVTPLRQCLATQPRDFRKFVTFTTFCAGYRNGTGVCNGDSGGGLVFPGPSPNDSWILHGIVSLSPRRRGTSFCDFHYYTVFTKVSMYVRWLKSLLFPPEQAVGRGKEGTFAGVP